MIISKKKYEEICSQNRALLKNKKETLETLEKNKEEIELLNNKNTQLDDQIAHKIDINKMQRERIDELYKTNDMLLKTNQRLTDWINKIINEVGIYEVNDRRSITIPIMKNPVKAMCGSPEEIKENMEQFCNQEEIIIPEIRFVRYNR
jgi:predicted nuclease with TOPRIM domain